jgi:hypothetical protein
MPLGTIDIFSFTEMTELPLHSLPLAAIPAHIPLMTSIPSLIQPASAGLQPSNVIARPKRSETDPVRLPHPSIPVGSKPGLRFCRCNLRIRVPDCADIELIQIPDQTVDGKDG